MEPQKSYSRHIAQKVMISTITSGTYIKEDEDAPNFLLTQNNQKIYRVNIMAIVIGKESIGSITSLLLDDSTDTLTLRSFEPDSKIDTLQVGAPVLVIGKVRMYNGSLYLTSEIIKVIGPSWLKLRSKELENNKIEPNIKINSLNQNNQNKQEINSIQSETIPTNSISDQKTIVNEEKIEDLSLSNNVKKETFTQPTENIIQLIQKLDTGNGAAIEEIIEKSTINDVEEIIERLIKNGEIFNNLPGKVKVL